MDDVANLWMASNAWQRAIRRALEPAGLTYVQYMLMRALGRLEQGCGPVTQSNLADIARVDEMMTSQVLRSLESKGMIARMPHANDGRSKAVALTESGLAALVVAVQLAERAEREFFTPLGDSAEATLAALGRLIAWG